MNMLSLEMVIFRILEHLKTQYFLLLLKVNLFDLSSGVLRPVTGLWGGFLLMIKYIDCYMVN